MDNLYLKKESIIKRCIDEGTKYFSSYQMQIIKSKYYTAITFDKKTEEYKNRIEELYNYVKETSYKNLDRAKKKDRKNRIKNQKIKRSIELHNYLTIKNENLKERINSLNNNLYTPPIYEENKEDYKDINIIYRMKESLWMTNNFLNVIYDKDFPRYLKIMIDHAFISYISKEGLNSKYPKYIESRKEIFNFIENALNQKNVNVNDFLKNIVNNEQLLKLFMCEVNPYYLDKTSEEYKLVKKTIKDVKNKNMSEIKALKKIESAVSNMNLNANMINLMIENNPNIKTL